MTAPYLIIKHPASKKVFAGRNAKNDKPMFADSCAKQYDSITEACDTYLELHERGLIGLTLAQERAESAEQPA